MINLRPSQRLFIVGATQSGKTYLARRIFAAMPPPRLVVDPKDDPDATGGGYAVTFRDPDRLPDAPVIRFVPRDPLDPDTYDRLFASVWRSPHRWFTWIDEAGVVLPSGRGMPPALGRLVAQGAAKGYGIMALNQRPVGVDPLFAANAEHVVTFRLGFPADVDAMAQIVGTTPRDLRRWLGSLPLHGFGWYDRINGRLTLADTVGSQGGP